MSDQLVPKSSHVCSAETVSGGSQCVNRGMSARSRTNLGNPQPDSGEDCDVSLILGAYPIEPDDPGQSRRLFELLGASGLYGGLELPYHSTGGVRWPEGAPRDWRAVVTAIPGTMNRMGADPVFGLAS